MKSMFDPNPDADEFDGPEPQLPPSAVRLYSQPPTVMEPALIYILIDQSESMAGTKIQMATDAVNKIIYDLILACSAGVSYKEKCYITVIGYGEKVKVCVTGSVAKIAKGSHRRETAKEKSVEASGIETEFDVEKIVYVEPKAAGRTPMADAFGLAYEGIRDWCLTYPKACAPVVINITDGCPDDFDPKKSPFAPKTEEAVKKLMSLGTPDGKLLLFNIHITLKTNDKQIEFPSDIQSIASSYARLLFRITSKLPERMVDDAKVLGFRMDVAPDSRAMLFNAPPEKIAKLLVVASSMVRQR